MIAQVVRLQVTAPEMWFLVALIVLLVLEALEGKGGLFVNSPLLVAGLETFVSRHVPQMQSADVWGKCLKMEKLPWQTGGKATVS